MSLVLLFSLLFNLALVFLYLNERGRRLTARKNYDQFIAHLSQERDQAEYWKGRWQKDYIRISKRLEEERADGRVGVQ